MGIRLRVRIRVRLGFRIRPPLRPSSGGLLLRAPDVVRAFFSSSSSLFAVRRAAASGSSFGGVLGGAGWAEGSAFFASAAFVFTGSTFFAGAGSGCWTTGFVAFFGGVSSTSSVGTSSRARPANSSTASSALSSIPNRSASSSKASSRSRSSASSSSSWTEGSDCAVVRCATARTCQQQQPQGREPPPHGRSRSRPKDFPTDVLLFERNDRLNNKCNFTFQFQGYLLACESALSLSINTITSRVKQLESSCGFPMRARDLQVSGDEEAPSVAGRRATKVRAGRVAPLPQSRAPRRLQTARSRSRASRPIDRNPLDPSGMRPKARGLSGARARPPEPIPSTHPRFAKTRARRDRSLASPRRTPRSPRR